MPAELTGKQFEEHAARQADESLKIFHECLMCPGTGAH